MDIDTAGEQESGPSSVLDLANLDRALTPRYMYIHVHNSAWICTNVYGNTKLVD